MKKLNRLIIAAGAAFALLILLTGCKATLPNVENKAVTLKGYSAVNLIRTGYDPTTQTFTPSITSIITSGLYHSVPVDTASKDYLHYSSESSASVFNASAKTSTETLIFTTSDKALMKIVVKALAENIAPSTSGTPPVASAPISP